MAGVLLLKGFAYGQAPSRQEYVQALFNPIAFPAQHVLHMDIQKEKAVQVVADGALLNERIRECYESSERIRSEFSTLEAYAAEVRTTQSNQFQKTSQRITTSTQCQHLREYGTDGDHVSKEVIQYRVDGQNWQTLQIDHDRLTASLQKGAKGIFTDYRETGMFNSMDQLLLIIFFRILPNMSQDAAVDALCSGETLSAGTKSMKLESREDADPAHLLLTYQDAVESSSIEFQLDPKKIGVLISKKSAMPQATSLWAFTRDATIQNISSAYPRKTVFTRLDTAGRLQERESVTLEDISEAADWNVRQLWADKMDEIKVYQVSVQP
jgi:hypothetical protein